MRRHSDKHGTNRENKRNVTVIIACMMITCVVNIIACSPIAPVSEEDGFDYEIEDWQDNGDSGTTTPDSVRNMTHADSIRFGLLPAE